MNSNEKLIRKELGLGKVRIAPLAGGWRKKTFLIKAKEKKVVCLVPKSSISKRKLLKASHFEEKFEGRELLDFQEVDDFWLVVFKFLPGKVKWQWREKESYAIGQFSARLHQKRICHLDIKPGNVLWSNNKILALIDFEELKQGKKWLAVDLANTLSWVLISGGNQKEFFRGYQQTGLRIDYGRIDYYLPKFLKMRTKEGNRQAFLLLAKKKLESYQKGVESKLLKVPQLSNFRSKNRTRSIVFVVGAWGLLHWGHLDFLKKAKKQGDLLVVGVGSDASRKRLKGNSFPIVGDKTRAETLCFFDFVDAVVIIDEDDVLEPLKKLKPNIFYISKKDWQQKVRKAKEVDFLKKIDGKVIKAFYSMPRVSSSKMVEKVALLKIKNVLFSGVKRQPMLKVNDGKKNPKEVKFKDLDRLGKKLHPKKKTIVFTSLTADLFHLGHARFIQKAKSLADILVVGVPSNKSVRALKGRGRPMVDETARALLLSALGNVDWVVVFDERTILSCLRKLKPDVFFTVDEGWNNGLANSPEARFMKSIGGKIVRSKRQAPYLSASKMIDKAAGELIKTRFFNVLKTAEETPVLNADFDAFAPEAQLAAREKGFYEKVLAEVAKRGKCVFCDLKNKYLVEEKDGVVLTVALYPYIDGHLLIIPWRHIKSIQELTKTEWQAVFYLNKKGEEILRRKLGIKNFWFLLREGQGIKAGKTVDHLHFHLIPYDSKVIKMVDTKLTIKPIDMARKLR